MEINKEEIIYKKVSELKLNEKNPRKNDEAVATVMKSIQEFGFKNPLIIDGNNKVWCGNTRLKASRKLGLEKVPCIVADDLTEEQIRKLALIDNRSSEIAEWDFDLLSEELADLDLSDFELDWGIDELEPEKEVEEDDFDVESAIPEEPKAKLGDIYQLGEHRLMCGNALKIEDIKKLLNGNDCELTFTDPPYQLDTQGGGILKKANSMKQIRDNGVDNFDPSQLKIVSNTNIYCHNKPLIKSYIELAEQNKKPYDLCFYKKECTVPNYKGHLMTDCEYIAVIGNQDPNKGLEKELYSKCYTGKKDKDNELSYSKPIGLCAKYIKLYSKQNVLDLFGGSGSTLIACEQLNRKCYMMELDPHYVDVIIKRYEDFTGKKAVKIN
ncbi:MAG: ParB N-terminal domain-containing protein [Methanobrevibacter sp.]|nr:ParB N-terminal domain-containing protein [Methanobrevibacter sp.]MBO7712121.1 ParB N-terminal domain-containing protein [Methanobrevibacter sp.]